jgi:hypothetical protein
MSKNIYHLSLDLSDTSIKKDLQKNNSFKSYRHITDLGIWTYTDGELILTPFEKEVSNVEKNYN